jgi:NAD(P)-dependent dehydrogenase (short-subunit alcohol dehydrogenase family)
MVEVIYQAQRTQCVDGSARDAIYHPSGRWCPQQRRQLAAKRVGDCNSFHDQFLKVQRAQSRFWRPMPASITSLHALKRVARPEELARSVLYLASDDSAFVTGTASLVDGGASITRT